VPKPRRLPSTRRAIPHDRLAEINHVAATTGNDPDLDTLLLRLHTETACRRGGELALRPQDLDPDQCLILLRERRHHPLAIRLTHPHARTDPPHRPTRHHSHRPAPPLPQPLAHHRRYDHLWTRIGHHLPWVATHQITTHWLRRTTLTWVDRHHGYAIARAGRTGGPTNSPSSEPDLPSMRPTSLTE
jgi:integrase/recombinase XerC